MSAESPPTLLLLGGASDPAGADVVAQARARGVDVCLVDTPANLAAAPAPADAAAEVVAMDYADVAACLRWAGERPGSRPFLGVYGFRETAVAAVAEVAQALRLPGNPVPVARRVRDKHACRQALARHGFRQPVSALCSSAAQARAFLAGTAPGPWVVKPSGGWGSAGVSLVRGPADLAAALAHVAGGRAALRAELARQGIGQAPPGVALPQFLVERFQPGREYSAEGVMVAGSAVLLAITRKVTTGAPHFVETGHVLPVDLGPGRDRQVRRALASALAALGIGWGVLHVEFWLDGADVVLGEVHLRPGGDYIHVMTQHVTGIDLHGAVIDQLLGRVPDPSRWRPRRGAAVQFVLPPPGRVTAVHGWDAVRADPHFLTGRLGLRPGDRVRPLGSSADRSSLVVATAGTAEQAAREAARLVARLRVDVRTEVRTEVSTEVRTDPPAPARTRHPIVLLEETS